MGKILLIFLMLAAFSAEAQAPFFLEKGKSYYDNNQYREALYYFNRFIAIDSSQGEVYKLRGNCYQEFNHLDSALSDYRRALRLSPELDEVNFNIALVYTKRNQNTEAQHYVRRYLNARPEDPEAIFMYARLKLSDQPDSGLYYLEKAYMLDPHEVRFHDALTSEYLSMKKYQEAYVLARTGRKLHPHHFELMVYQAYAAYATGRFRECSQLSDSLYEAHGDLGFFVLKLKAEILEKTDSDAIEQDGFSFRFRHINSHALSSLDQRVLDHEHKYYYNGLLSRYRNGDALGLDEYFMLYFGFTSDPRYSPYTSNEKSIQELFDQNDFTQAVREARTHLNVDEFNPRLIEYLFAAQRESGEDFEHALRSYLAIMEGILATGDGTSFESAYMVTSPMHEYDILSYLGYTSGGQSLRRNEQYSFDVLKGLREGETTDIYFNIDKPFNSLRTSFRSSNAGTKKEKKKRKK